MSRTSSVVSRPGFLVQEQNAARTPGKQVDWDRVPASRENAHNNKEIKGGTPVSFGKNGVLPREDTEFSISSATASGDTATITTASDHNYEVGEEVTVQGTSNYDGTFTITAVPASNQFEYDLGSTPGDESTGTALQEAKGILLTTANEGNDHDSLSGYGVIRGGVVYGELLAIGSLSLSTVKSELKANSDYGFNFETYSDNR